MSNLNIKDKKVKNSSVYTDKKLSKYLFDLIDKNYNFKTILDPCIGEGGLSKYYNESDKYKVIGIDVNKEGEKHCDLFFNQNIKELNLPDLKPDLIIMNPPFNGNRGGLLYPHLFLKNITELYGEEIPIMMITGDNFLNNNRLKSKRLIDISNSNYQITTIITLPLDVFEGVLFNTQVLFFNMDKLKPHYIYDISKNQLT